MKSVIFQDKYGVDPSTLTLAEIDAMIFKGKEPVVVHMDCFPVESYDIDKLFNEAIKGL